MCEVFKLGRRDFLKISAGAGAGLWLGAGLGGDAQAATPAAFSPSAFLSIDRKGAVTIWVAKSEMGQGIRTSLPMLVAEELEADWSKIRIEPAVADAKYGEMMTGGSTSVRTTWEPLRKVGATAREMLLAAAAARWRVDRTACRAEAGAVIGPGGKRLSYGELAAEAAKLPVPKDPPLKDPKDFRLLGKPVHRLDTPDKITGRAVFGIDVHVPRMLHATVARCPVFGGKAKSFDASKAKAVRGVRGVYQVPSGVAVVADSTWSAIQGREALAIVWDEGPAAGLDSAAIRAAFEKALEKPQGVARRDGAGAAALQGAAKKVEALYELPFLAHATMEPMNCTADVRGGRATLWSPNQAPQWHQQAVAKALGIAPEEVTVHTTLLGGGFGRRAMPDFSVEAALVSKAAGAPVKVLWTREDDMGHDFYRPASLHRLAAGLDAQGRLGAWTHRVVAPSITQQVFGRPSFQPGGKRPDMVEGAWDLPYGVPAIEVDYAMPEVPVPIGWWRSVYASQTAFANECFLDEIAAAARRDPLELRRELLAADPRLRGAVELAAEKAGWGQPLPAGRGRGIACHFSFGSRVAEVAEVSSQGGRPQVHRVVAAVDCGRVVNPDTVAAQIEGAIVYGLSAALRGEITIERGRAKQTTFGEYAPLRLEEMPVVEVHIVPSSEPPGGIGEPGLPPIAPAVANAWFSASGRRARRLPIREVKG
jgi:isoquinoline 1-oxidoreductase beta subunit